MVWFSKDGRKITARAVAKNEKNVTLRLTDGKRVAIPLDQLRKEDAEWVANWKPPVIKVSASEQRILGYTKFHAPIMSERKFTFSRSDRLGYGYASSSLSMFEKEIPGILAAFKEFYALASKPLTDVKSYKKVICKGRYTERRGGKDLLIFEVVDEKPFLSGEVCIHGRITPEELLPLQDFLETFSVRDWDRQQDEIKKRFE